MVAAQEMALFGKQEKKNVATRFNEKCANTGSHCDMYRKAAAAVTVTMGVEEEEG